MHCSDLDICGAHTCVNRESIGLTLTYFTAMLIISIADVNECSDLDICGAHTCVNTESIGLTLTYFTVMLINLIADVNECSDLDICGTHTCVNRESIGLTLTYFTEMLINFIADVNECSDLDFCGAHTCVNTESSFWCKCLAGFVHTEESRQFCVGKELYVYRLGKVFIVDKSYFKSFMIDSISKRERGGVVVECPDSESRGPGFDSRL